MKKTTLILAVVFFTICPARLFAISTLIGDVDGFGFTGVSSLVGAYGGAADINGNGILDSGDVMPDLN